MLNLSLKAILTLLSELGIIVSVIQEPNREPEARTVMGLLTPVSFPQPARQTGGGGASVVYSCCINIHMTPAGVTKRMAIFWFSERDIRFSILNISAGFVSKSQDHAPGYIL